MANGSLEIRNLEGKEININLSFTFAMDCAISSFKEFSHLLKVVMFLKCFVVNSD